MGYLQVNTGRLDEGAATFSAVLEQRPDVVAAYVGRGTAHALARRLDEAQRDLDTARRLAPHNSDAWKRCGQVLAAVGRDADALRALRRAVRLSPDDAEPCHQLGSLLVKRFDHRRALPWFVRAAAHAARQRTQRGAEPHVVQQATQQQTAALLQQALCENAMGNMKGSVLTHRTCIDLAPHSPDAYVSMALTLKELGDPAAALEYIDR